MTEWYDTDGGPVTADCWYHCVPGRPAMCDTDGCACLCHDEAARARQLDDRPADKLAAIAAEIDRERTPELEALLAERYGRGVP